MRQAVPELLLRIAGQEPFRAIQGGLTRWPVLSLRYWGLSGALFLGIWLPRGEATGCRGSSLGSEFFIALVVQCMRLGTETELFAYQEEGPTH